MTLLYQPRPGERQPIDRYVGAATRVTPLDEFLGARLRRSFDLTTTGAALDDLEVGSPSALMDLTGISINLADDAGGLSEDDWRTGPHYREGLDYEPGMTEGSAAARAEIFDERRLQDALIAGRDGGVGSFLLGLGADLAGGVPDPFNFVPFVGPARRLALVARLGRVGGGAAVGSINAVLGTAATLPYVIPRANYYGDDLGWQDAAYMLGLAAVIGGTIGGGTAGVSALRERLRGVSLNPATVRSAFTPVADAVRAITRNQEPPDIRPARRETLHGIRRSLDSSRRRDPALVDRDSGRLRVVTGRGTEVEVDELVVEARDLITSDRADYPAGLQPRDRSRVMSDLQVAEIAGRLDPARLLDSRTADTGAPIVAPDGVVESGNGRVAAIRLAYERNGEPGRAYRETLEALGYDTAGMDQPVLVRRRVTDLSEPARQRFTAEANERTTLDLSPTERALADAQALDDASLGLWRGGDADAPANRAFVRSFARDVVSTADAAGLRRSDGALSTAGARRVEAAVLARAYDDPDLLEAVLESAAEHIRGIAGALSDAAGPWARMRAAVADGLIDPRFDVTEHLVAAVRLVETARRDGRLVTDLLVQEDLLAGGAALPMTERLVRLMYRDAALVQPLSRERLAAGLSSYADQVAARAEAGADLPGLGVAAADPADMLAAARRVQQRLGSDDLAPIDPVLTAGRVAGDEAVRAELADRFRAAGVAEDEALAAARLIADWFRVHGLAVGEDPAALYRELTGGGLRVERVADPAAFGEAAQQAAVGQPVAVLRGDEIGARTLDIAELRERAMAYYDQHLAPQAVVREGFGEVRFDGRGRRKTRATSADPDKLRLIPAIPDIIRHGRHVGSAPGRHADSASIRRVHWFEGQVDLDGTLHTARVQVQERTDGRFYYNIVRDPSPLMQGGSGRAGAPKRELNRGRLPEAEPRAPAGTTGSSLAARPPGENIRATGDDFNLAFVEADPRASIEFGEDGSVTMRLGPSADASSLLHEPAHLFLELRRILAGRAEAPGWLRRDQRAIEDWLGAAPGERLTTDQHERFARAFERYVMEGEAPSARLRRVFDRFAAWLRRIYSGVEDLAVDLPPEIRAVFDRMLAGPEALRRRPPRDRATARPIRGEHIDEPPPEGFEDIAARAGPDGEDLDGAIADLQPELDEIVAAGRAVEADLAELQAADAALAELAPAAPEGERVLFQSAVPQPQAPRRNARGRTPEEQALADARQRRFHAALNIVVRDRINAQLAGYREAGMAPDKAILALLEGTTVGVPGGRRSAAAYQTAFTARYLGTLMSEIARQRPHLERVFQQVRHRAARRALAADVAREMHRPDGGPWVTRSADAQFLADLFRRTFEAHRRDLNALGADIGRLNGYLPHVHDEMRLVKASRDEWVRFTDQRLDHARMFPEGADTARRHEVLGEIYDTIVTGRRPGLTAAGRGDYVGAANLARTAQQSRVLHFADADGWLQYNERFGQGDAISAVVSASLHTGRMAGLMHVLGPNPEVMLRSVVDAEAARVRGDASLSAERRQSLVEDKLRLEPGGRNLGITAAWAEVSGFTSSAANLTAARIASDARALQSMAKLGGATLSSVTDLATVVGNMTYRGTPLPVAWANTLLGYAGGRGRGVDRRVAYLAGEGFEGIIGHVVHPFAAQDLAPGMMSRVMTQFFRLSGLEWWTDTGRSVAARVFAADLGQRSGTAWADLPVAFRDVLGEHGFDAARWDLLRSTAWQMEDGRAYLTPDRVAEIEPVRLDALFASEIAAARARFSTRGRKAGSAPRDTLTPAQQRDFNAWLARRRAREAVELELGLRRMLADEARVAIIGADDPAVRRLTTLGTRRGTAVGETVRFIMQFKAFPLGFTRRVGYRNAHLLRRRGGAAVVHVGALIAGLMVTGYAAQVMKDAARGFEPRDPTRWRTLLSVGLQSGGAGIYGDFLFGHASRFGNSWLETAAGPGIGALADLGNLAVGATQGETSRLQGLNLLLGNTPFINLFYLRPALDLLVLDSLRDAISPGYLRRQARRRQDEYGQGRLWGSR